ncbi:MAG: DUF2088 domain-containing protein [Spirochaetia bacterium]|nr:DUF2088 domain-containing protein [Spirochaetia bacterium]
MKTNPVELPEIGPDHTAHLAEVHKRIHHPPRPEYVPGSSGLVEDPEVVHIKQDSAKRIVFSGEDIVEIKMPVGSRVIYSKPPVKGLPDVKAAVRYAVMHPERMDPLPSLLRPGMKVTIAIDDISLPLPPMALPAHDSG